MTRYGGEIEQAARRVEDALAQAYAGSVFTHWQGAAADAASRRMLLFYSEKAAAYEKRLKRYRRKK